MPTGILGSEEDEETYFFLYIMQYSLLISITERGTRSAHVNGQKTEANGPRNRRYSNSFIVIMTAGRACGHFLMKGRETRLAPKP